MIVIQYQILWYAVFSTKTNLQTPNQLNSWNKQKLCIENYQGWQHDPIYSMTHTLAKPNTRSTYGFMNNFHIFSSQIIHGMIWHSFRPSTTLRHKLRYNNKMKHLHEIVCSALNWNELCKKTADSYWIFGFVVFFHVFFSSFVRSCSFYSHHLFQLNFFSMIPMCVWLCEYMLLVSVLNDVLTIFFSTFRSSLFNLLLLCLCTMYIIH